MHSCSADLLPAAARSGPAEGIHGSKVEFLAYRIIYQVNRWGFKCCWLALVGVSIGYKGCSRTSLAYVDTPATKPADQVLTFALPPSLPATGQAVHARHGEILQLLNTLKKVKREVRCVGSMRGVVARGGGVRRRQG